MASAAEGAYNTSKGDVERRGSIAKTEKGRWERLWPVIACGAGLFSDGYLNNVGLARAPTTNATSSMNAIATLFRSMIADHEIDHRPSQYHAQQDIPRLVHQVVRSSECSEYYVRRHGPGHAVLRIHIRSLFTKVVALCFDYYYHPVRCARRGVLWCWWKSYRSARGTCRVSVLPWYR